MNSFFQLLLFFLCCAHVTFSLDRTRRKCHTDNHNFTSCEFWMYNEKGNLQYVQNMITGTNNLWNTNLFSGHNLINASNIEIFINSSTPYYYLTMQVYWTDFTQTFAVDSHESFLRYRNVRNDNNNNNNNEWLEANATLEYVDSGSGILAQYGFNFSSDDNRNGVLTDEIYINIVFETPMVKELCQYWSTGDCRLTNVQLWSHTIPTLAPTGIPSYFPSHVPSFNPASMPTNLNFPSTVPSTVPSQNPTLIPSDSPSSPPSGDSTTTVSPTTTSTTTPYWALSTSSSSGSDSSSSSDHGRGRGSGRSSGSGRGGGHGSGSGSRDHSRSGSTRSGGSN